MVFVVHALQKGVEKPFKGICILISNEHNGKYGGLEMMVNTKLPKWHVEPVRVVNGIECDAIAEILICTMVACIHAVYVLYYFAFIQMDVKNNSLFTAFIS